MLNELLIEKINKIYDKSFVILQIGACDGILNDPIYEFILENKSFLHALEPINNYFLELNDTYKNLKSVKTYNCAISDKTEKKYINYINSEKSPVKWLKGCSSLYENKNVLSNYIGKKLNIEIDDELKNYIKNNTHKILVNCYTLKDFLSINQINKIDIFISDTEGEDFEIFKQIDFNLYKPKIYFTEIYNWSNEEKGFCISKLNELNYICVTDGYNMLAYE